MVTSWGGPLYPGFPEEASYLFLYYFGANNIRFIAPQSTPLWAQTDPNQESSITAKDIVVVFTPHSDSSPDKAKELRSNFQEQVKEPLERLGGRYIDVGENSDGHKELLDQLDSEDLVIIEVSHSGADRRLYIYKDGSVHIRDIQKAQGTKIFMSCSSIQEGFTAATVRAGAGSASGSVERITLDEANKTLQRWIEYLEQHPEGARPSEIEYYLRIQSLIENGIPGYEPVYAPTSITWIVKK